MNFFEFKLKLRDVLGVYIHAVKIAVWGQPIIVYQMPKTGSASITASLEAVGFRNVFHVHSLNSDADYSFEYSRKLSNLLKGLIKKGRKVKLITCVRDPVARNVSDVFQLLKTAQRFYENGAKFPFAFSSSEAFHNQDMNVNQIREVFFNDYPYHDLPLFWFDKHIKENFDIDIYAQPFPKEAGYLRLSKGNVDLLVLKLESSDLMKETQIAKLVDVPDFKLIRTNVTTKDKHSYSRLYKTFKETVPFSSKYLERMYDSSFVSHFYNEEEIEKMRSGWKKVADDQSIL